MKPIDEFDERLRTIANPQPFPDDWNPVPITLRVVASRIKKVLEKMHLEGCPGECSLLLPVRCLVSLDLPTVRTLFGMNLAFIDDDSPIMVQRGDVYYRSE